MLCHFFPFLLLSFQPSFIHPSIHPSVFLELFLVLYFEVSVTSYLIEQDGLNVCKCIYLNIYLNGSELYWDRAVKLVCLYCKFKLTCFNSLEGCDMKRLRLSHMAHAGLCFCEWRQNSSSACLSGGIAEEISCLIHGQKEWLIHLPPCLAPGHCYSG